MFLYLSLLLLMMSPTVTQWLLPNKDSMLTKIKSLVILLQILSLSNSMIKSRALAA